MSSRSIGVTHVWLSRWTMSCVMRSPSCSQTTMSRASSPWSGHSWTIRSSRPAARTMFAPASSNRSKNSRSLGANSLESCTMGRECSWPTRLRALALAQLLLEPRQLLGRDPVGVLGRRERARADVLDIGAHPAQHLAAHVRVGLDELRLEAAVDAEHVVQHEHLPVRAGAGADTDHGDLHLAHDHVADVGRDRLEDDREAARLLQLQR